MSRIKNFIRNINYLTKHSLWDQREEDIVYLTNKILDDGLYEYGIESSGQKKLSILSTEESLRLLKEHPKSFVRTGDGECKIMMGMDQPFQKYDKELAERLIDLLQTPRNNLYVGVNRAYFQPFGDGELAKAQFNRRYAYEYRQVYYKYLNSGNCYIDANFTLHNIGLKPNAETDSFFEQWKQLFKNKEIVLICGEGILDQLNYDIFELSKNKTYVYGPKKHAWSMHERLMEQIKRKSSKDQLLVFILGMAGKAMIPELTECGYMCWDIGHLAKYYDAYKKNVLQSGEDINAFYRPD